MSAATSGAAHGGAATTSAATSGAATTGASGEEGTFCLVLHSHLPWLAHHGSWPVGEEWLYQAWAHAYLPLLRLCRQLADEGHTEQLTLGVSPVLAAQLDDPYALRTFHSWLGHWQLRARHAAAHWHGRGEHYRQLAAEEHASATAATEDFELHWRHGFSPLLRELVDAQVLELLGGPLSHPFQPLLEEPVRSFALAEGLADTAGRIGSRPRGLWAPECGYVPGLERDYAAAGVERFLVDGPSLGGQTAAARTVGDSDVVCFGRDLEVTYRVWSPTSGYPGHPDYRDFHTFDHTVGLKPCRVTGKDVPPRTKAPYEPGRAAHAVAGHVRDFTDAVVARLRELRARHGERGLVVAAYDTELFGHWWHEGPAWLAGVLRELPRRGVRVTTLRGALEAGHLGGPVDLPASSWGSGKDWRVWDGQQVADLAASNAALQRRLLAGVAGMARGARDPVADQLVREALLALSSDWAFMITKDSAAGYARDRARTHRQRFDELAGMRGAESSEGGQPGGGRGPGDDRWAAAERAGEFAALDNPFPGLDARGLAERAAAHPPGGQRPASAPAASRRT